MTGKSFGIISCRQLESAIISQGVGAVNDRRSIYARAADRSPANRSLADMRQSSLSTAIRMHVKWKSTISL